MKVEKLILAATVGNQVTKICLVIFVLLIVETIKREQSSMAKSRQAEFHKEEALFKFDLNPCAFVFLCLCVFTFAVVVLIDQTASSNTYLNRGFDEGFPPQNYSGALVFFTAFIDICTIVLGLIILAFVAVQVFIITKVTWIATKSLALRVVIITISSLFALLYLFDVSVMLYYAWGVPAFKMT